MSALIGFVVSIIAPNLNLNLDFMMEGMFWGLSIGIFWSLVRFYLHGEKGVAKSQKELAAGTAYMAIFLGGYFLGWGLQKLLLLF